MPKESDEEEGPHVMPQSGLQHPISGGMNVLKNNQRNERPAEIKMRNGGIKRLPFLIPLLYQCGHLQPSEQGIDYYDRYRKLVRNEARPISGKYLSLNTSR